MELVDTHCHIHFPDYTLDPEQVLDAAYAAGVTRLLCVGCTVEDSERGVEFAGRYDSIWASIGIHPHEAKEYIDQPAMLEGFAALASKPRVVAIGECGLDYFYTHSPKEQQIKLLRFQIELALQHDLPLIFHVRDAFDDFWPIFDDYTGIRGVVHSFTATERELEAIVKRNLYVGLNGIMTFTKDAHQLAAAKAVPLDNVLLETDAPFLTPTPYRGTINEPKRVLDVANFLSELRGESLEVLATATTRNARTLFNI